VAWDCKIGHIRHTRQPPNIGEGEDADDQMQAGGCRTVIDAMVLILARVFGDSADFCPRGTLPE